MDCDDDDAFSYVISTSTDTAVTPFQGTQLNAIIYKRTEWLLLKNKTLPNFPHPPILALLQSQSDNLTVVAASIHISPNQAQSDSTAKASVIQSRIWMISNAIIEACEEWDLRPPFGLDFCPLIGGDFNTAIGTVSVPHGLFAATPQHLQTLNTTGRSADGFLVPSWCIEQAHWNPISRLYRMNENKEFQLSDHNMVTLTFES